MSCALSFVLISNYHYGTRVMPLPNVTEANRCNAKCKARQDRCKNLKAFQSATVCRMHGARRKETILRGKEHPAYIDGTQSRQAKAKYSEAAARLRELEQMMVDTGMVGTEFKRTVGRKPKFPS